MCSTTAPQSLKEGALAEAKNELNAACATLKVVEDSHPLFADMVRESGNEVDRAKTVLTSITSELVYATLRAEAFDQPSELSARSLQARLRELLQSHGVLPARRDKNHIADIMSARNNITDATRAEAKVNLDKVRCAFRKAQADVEKAEEKSRTKTRTFKNMIDSSTI